MRDFFIGWHEKFQPLGPALKTPRIEVDEKSAIAEFEERSFDHPSCTGGNAPSLSPQALATTPVARFKVGDRVRAHGKYTGTIAYFHDVTGGPRVKMDGDHDYITEKDGSVGFPKDHECLEHIQPSDTQQWVEWKGGVTCPVPLKALVEYRLRSGLTGKPCPAIDLFWCHSNRPFDVVAYRVVQ